MAAMSQVAALNVEFLRKSAVEFLEAVVTLGAEHPSRAYDAVTHYVMVEHPSPPFRYCPVCP